MLNLVTSMGPFPTIVSQVCHNTEHWKLLLDKKQNGNAGLHYMNGQQKQKYSTYLSLTSTQGPYVGVYIKVEQTYSAVQP